MPGQTEFENSIKRPSSEQRTLWWYCKESAICFMVVALILVVCYDWENAVGNERNVIESAIRVGFITNIFISFPACLLGYFTASLKNNNQTVYTHKADEVTGYLILTPWMIIIGIPLGIIVFILWLCAIALGG